MNAYRVAVCSFFDGIRQPVFLITLLFYLFIDLILPVAAQAAFFQQRKMVVDSSLALIFSLGLLLTVFLADTSVRSELGSGRALLFFTKPVKNIEYVLGKFLGLASVITFFVFTCSAASVMVIYAVEGGMFFSTPLLIHLTIIAVSLGIAALLNYYFGMVFSGTVALVVLVLFFAEVILYPVLTGVAVFWSFFAGAFLLLLSLYILNALAVLVAIKWRAVMSFAIMLTFFGGGVLAQRSEYLAYFFPDWRAYWGADMLSGQGNVPWELVMTGGYRSLVFNLIFIILAVLLLRNTEAGNASTQ